MFGCKHFCKWNTNMEETTTVFMVTMSFALISAIPMQLTISLSKAIKFPQSTEDEGIEDVLGSWKKFQDFQIRFNKTYKSEEEKRQRFKIFKENLAKIIQHNTESDRSHPKGIHRFSDWTGKGFIALHANHDLLKSFFSLFSIILDIR